MRFSTTSILLVVGTAFAAPSLNLEPRSTGLEERYADLQAASVNLAERSTELQPIMKRSLATDFGATTGALVTGLINPVLGNNILDFLLGDGILANLLNKFGFNFFARTLDLYNNGASPGTIQVIGTAFASYLKLGGAVPALDNEIFQVSGGKIHGLAAAIGSDDVAKAIGLKPS